MVRPEINAIALTFWRRCLVALGLAAALSAAPHRLRVHPNATIVIHSIAQGPEGFLWLAASDGLYRFDGFQYLKIPEYPFATARAVGFTKDGSLWVSSSEGLVRGKSRFEIVLREDVIEMAATPDYVFAKFSLRENARIGLDGKILRFAQFARGPLTTDAASRLWYVNIRGTYWAECCLDPDWPDHQRMPEIRMPVPELWPIQTVRDGIGRLWAAGSDRAVALHGGRQIMELRRTAGVAPDRVPTLVAGSRGQLWFMGDRIEGLLPPIVFEDRAMFAHLTPSAAWEDGRGHLWVAVPGRGLLEWMPDSGWERWFANEFGGERHVQAFAMPGGGVGAATSGNIWRFDPEARSWKKMTTEPQSYVALLPLPNGEFLASVPGLVRIASTGRVLETITPPNSPGANIDFRLAVADKQGRIWVAHGKGLFRVEGPPGRMLLTKVALPDERPKQPNVTHLQADADGRVWVAYEEGVAWLDEQDRWHRIAAQPGLTGTHSLAATRVENREVVWAAHRGRDRAVFNQSTQVSRSEREGGQWSTEVLRLGGDPRAADTRFLAVDSRGWIWRGTADGVFVSDGMHTSPQDWLHIDFDGGLASHTTARYGFLEDAGGGVWIGGDLGITRLKPDANWFRAPADARAPRISWFQAGDQASWRAEELREALSRSPSLVRLQIGSLEAPLMRDYPFRYRVLPDATEWRYTKDGLIELRNLGRGTHTLEVAYTGEGESPLLSVPLPVGRWPGVPSWLALLAVPTAGSGMGALVRSERLRYRSAKAVFLLRRALRMEGRHLQGEEWGRGESYVGKTLAGRFKILQMVSRGGFSRVYEARDVRGAGRAAIKILDAIPGNDGWVRERFASEVAALRSVDHPCVVKVLDSWIGEDGAPCLAMPFLDGPTLRAELEPGAMQAGRVGRLVRQMGDALAAIHEKGIVHRDYKPENVILLQANTDEESAVLVDFGTAGMRASEMELAMTTLLAGSLQYLAPERLTGHYSPATDVYALGVVALEMLTGKRLADFSSAFTDDGFELEIAGCLERAGACSQARALAAALVQAIHPDPRQRPKAVGEWASGIARQLSGDSAG